ncbi:GLR2.2 [Symbiodinium natans]|uniref:GLR2.2 protein n=1 Tax=Symbiodinium natans TaxID=878477 RepID=A0A812QMJ5_9DINO|nr:GLR2.2 [Symbiodinium natans]
MVYVISPACSYLLVALVVLVVHAASPPGGAFECPCISNTSSSWAVIRAELLTHAGYGSDYGLQGCQEYDRDLVQSGCSQNEADFCERSWCYVDVDACRYNETACTAAGGQPGGTASPSCRTRPMTDSSLLSTAVYSYETCGYRNTYDLGPIMEPIAGKVMRFAADDFSWFVYTKPEVDPENPNVTKAGVDYDFFVELASNFNPQATFEFVDGFSTQVSRSLFSSSWTACVHDVAVGYIDACVGPFWITPERAEMTQFLSISVDLFYLIAPKQDETPSSLGDFIAAPFRPFMPETWLAIVCFLSVLACTLWAIEGWETGCTLGWRSQAENGFVKAYETVQAFLAGGVEAESHNLPRKFLVLGFAFFLLIVSESYSASLTSMLVVRREASGNIENIEDAIERGMKICIPAVIAPTLKSMHGNAQFVELGDSRSPPRHIYAGDCEVGIMAQSGIDLLESGALHQSDCENVRSNGKPESEYRCETDSKGKARDDCNLLKVGEVLTSVGVGYPVNTKAAQSLSWAVTKATMAGKYSDAMRSHQSMKPRSQCLAAAEISVEEDGLPVESMVGVIIISSMCLGVSVVILIGRMLCQRRDPQSKPEGEDAEAADADAA